MGVLEASAHRARVRRVAARKEEERRAARELRRLGFPLAGIAGRLGVAKSSVSIWVRDVEPLMTPHRHRQTRLPLWDGKQLRDCSRCRRTLPAVLFGRYRGSRQWWCRSCFRIYFAERRTTHAEASARSKAQRIRAARQLVTKTLSASRCCDCGRSEAAVLEFDHVGAKRGTIARLVSDGANPERIQAEIAECEIVCANCHRRRTARRAGWLKLAPASSTGDIAYDRNRRIAYDALAAGCKRCGESAIEVLDFDHIRSDKRMSVMRLVHIRASAESVRDEIAKCQILCACCHRLITAERRRVARML